MKPQMISLLKSRGEADVLKDECEVFSRYLVDHKPNAYVTAKYEDAHHTGIFSQPASGPPFDALLLLISRVHPLVARLVDTYTSVFRKKSIVRKKMILLLAILETCSPTFVDFDLVDSRGRAGLCLGIAGQSAAFGVSLILGALLFLPLQMILAIASIFPDGAK